MTVKNTSGLRERKKKETRNRLALAAVELLTEQGVEAATIAAISERADVSSRTFHNYFPHREAAILHFLRYLVAQAIKIIEDAPDGLHPVDVMRMLTHEFNAKAETRNTYAQIESLFIGIQNSPQVDLETECLQLLKEFSAAVHDYCLHRGDRAHSEMDPFDTYILVNASIGATRSLHLLGEVEPRIDATFDILKRGFSSVGVAHGF